MNGESRPKTDRTAIIGHTFQTILRHSALCHLLQATPAPPPPLLRRKSHLLPSSKVKMRKETAPAAYGFGVRRFQSATSVKDCCR